MASTSIPIKELATALGILAFTSCGQKREPITAENILDRKYELTDMDAAWHVNSNELATLHSQHTVDKIEVTYGLRSSGLDLENMLENSDATVFLCRDHDDPNLYIAIRREAAEAIVAGTELTANYHHIDSPRSIIVQTALKAPNAQMDATGRGAGVYPLAILLDKTCRDMAATASHEIGHYVAFRRDSAEYVRDPYTPNKPAERQADMDGMSAYTDYSGYIHLFSGFSRLGKDDNASDIVRDTHDKPLARIQATITAFAKDTTLSLEERMKQYAEIAVLEKQIDAKLGYPSKILEQYHEEFGQFQLNKAPSPTGMTQETISTESAAKSIAEAMQSLEGTASSPAPLTLSSQTQSPRSRIQR